MSALPPKADIGSVHCDVRFVPKADVVLSVLIPASGGGKADRRLHLLLLPSLAVPLPAAPFPDGRDPLAVVTDTKR